MSVSYSVSLAAVCSVSISFLSFPSLLSSACGASSCLRILEPASSYWWHVFHWTTSLCIFVLVSTGIGWLNPSICLGHSIKRALINSPRSQPLLVTVSLSQCCVVVFFPCLTLFVDISVLSPSSKLNHSHLFLKHFSTQHRVDNIQPKSKEVKNCALK